MKKEELRVIPPKNYVILGGLLLVTFFLLYYFYMWFDAYKESKTNMMILDKYMDVVNYNELENFLVENPDSIIYVSVLENDEIRDFEKKIKTSYREDKIEKNLLYLNIEKENISKEMEDKYSFGSLTIKDVPCVMVFDNGQIIDFYSVKDDAYDIDKFVSYVNSIVLVGDEIK